jgi:hypothetical protein
MKLSTYIHEKEEEVPDAAIPVPVHKPQASHAAAGVAADRYDKSS